MSEVVVITGAARGIGAAIADSFAEAGSSTLLVDLSDEVEATAESLGTRSADSVAVRADVATSDGRARVIASVKELGGEVSCLVNNAGITRDAFVRKMDEEDFLSVIRVNLGAPLQLAEELSPFYADPAAVVNVSSKSASGNLGQFNYAISKAGLIGMTRSLALSLAPRVRVNAIAPAFISTEMTDAIPDDLRQKFVSRIPFGRAGEASEVAEVVRWLASDGASYLTGQVLPICGGRSFGP